MKKSIILLAILLSFFTQNSSFSQSSWYLLNTGISERIMSVFFINDKTGWIGTDWNSSSGGQIYKTTNYGNNWTLQWNTGAQRIAWIQFTDSLVGYAAGGNSQAYILKTTNGGANWAAIYLGPPSTQLQEGFFINSNSGYFVGNDGIYKTTNGGSNFSNYSQSNIQGCFFNNINTGYACGSNTGIIKTTNAGNNWIIVSAISSLNSIYFTDINTGYTVGSFVYKTTNSGTNWNFSDSLSGISSKECIKFVNQNTGYICGSQGKILRTINAGVNWIYDTVPVPTSTVLWNISTTPQGVAYVVGNNGTLLRNFILTPILNNEYIPNDGRLQIRSITKSDNLCIGQFDSVWWYVNDSLVGRNHNMTYSYLQGTSKVKLKIKNNLSVTDSTIANVTRCVWKRYTSGQILAGLSMIGDSVLYAISTGDAVYKMDINGNFIYPLVVGGSVLSSCSIANDTSVFITSTDANLYGFKSDGSSMWPTIPLGGQATTTPTVDSISNRLYIGVSNGFFRAINRLTGTSAWSYLCNAPVRSSAVVSYERKLVVASTVGTIYGFNLNNPTPAPANWQLNLADSIFVSPCIDSSGYFYFGSRSGKVYKISLTGTSNAGIVWQTPLASAVTSSPTIDANGNIYVGTADGKFYSLNKNGGIRWFFQSPAQIKSTAAITTYQRIYFGNDAGEIYGLDSNKIVRFYYIDSSKISCAMLYQKGTLYFGNEAGRLFALYDSTGGSRGPVIPIWGTFQNNPRRTGVQKGLITNVNQISDKIPDKFELFQNYPNPFNPVTNIKYQIPKSSIVVLRIFDILGREVQTLVNEKQSPGIYNVDFNGTMLASGVYFYKIQAGTYSEIKKLILLK